MEIKEKREPKKQVIAGDLKPGAVFKHTTPSPVSDRESFCVVVSPNQSTLDIITNKGGDGFGTHLSDTRNYILVLNMSSDTLGIINSNSLVEPYTLKIEAERTN